MIKIINSHPWSLKTIVCLAFVSSIGYADVPDQHFAFVKIINLTGETKVVYFTGLGCAHVKNGHDYVCDYATISDGDYATDGYGLGGGLISQPAVTVDATADQPRIDNTPLSINQGTAALTKSSYITTCSLLYKSYPVVGKQLVLQCGQPIKCTYGKQPCIEKGINYN